MLKIGKGLKKKKKSKKNKHKDEELFTEEELEQYRREHQQKAEQELENTDDNTGEASEELQKFKLLTAGVDDILRQTQGRLDQIKKESYFQRKPTPSELKAQEEKERELRKQTKGNWIGFEEGSKKEEEKDEHKLEPQEESESEYEYEENDDLFDTTYVDAIASGEVKLAYVPDDDDEIDQGPDPFDTSTADEILKKVEEEERRKQKQISLGIAVDVLTGRAQRDKSILQESGLIEVETEGRSQVNKPKKRPRKIQDFSLLGSFDDNSNQLLETDKGSSKTESETIRGDDKPKSLLDDDLTIECELPEGDVLISEILVKQSPAKKEVEPVEEPEGKDNKNLKVLLNEFDTVKEDSSLEVKKLEEEDDFDEFTALAASSVANQKLEEELQSYEDLENDPFDTSVANTILNEEKQADIFGSVEGEIPEPETIQYISSERNWSAFEKEEEPADPFDTTFVENIQPGKCELKLLENEILGDVVTSAQKSDIHQEARILSRSDSDFDFNPRGESQAITEAILKSVQCKVSIQITDPSGIVETQRSSVSENSETSLRQLTLQHRDLLGGSTSDLSKLGDDPLPPTVDSPVEDFSKYSDPFDTSIVEQVAAPGKAELKYIEKELLSDVKSQETSEVNDDDFDPRAEGNPVHKVTFHIPPEVQSDLLSSVREEGARPLTPYYCDTNEEGTEDSEVFDFSDPFDTSHVISLPGKIEIKLIEQELESVQNIKPSIIPIHEKLGIEENSCLETGIKHSLSDQDFNPRAAEGEPETQENITNRRYSDLTGLPHRPPTSLQLKEQNKPDLLVVEEEISVKALTPAVEEDIANYIDPFDTSIAENIAPGKAELKVLEGELISQTGDIACDIKRSCTDPNFNPRDDNRDPGQEVKADVLNSSAVTDIITKPLTPVDLIKENDFDNSDPFDTSIAANLVPGKTELRLLESELIGQ